MSFCPRFLNANSQKISIQILDACIDGGGKDSAKTISSSNIDTVTLKNNENYRTVFNDNTYVKPNQNCQVLLFGSTPDGTTACIRVYGFQPFFYVQYSGTVTPWRLKSLYQQRFGLQTEVEDKKILYGWHPEQLPDGTYNANKRRTKRFIKLKFPNVTSMKRCMWSLKRDLPGTIPIEMNVEPIQKFMVQKNLIFCSWVLCNNYLNVPLSERITSCQLEIKCNILDIFPQNERQECAKLLIASMDIENDSLDGGFPMEDRDSIILIGTTFQWLGEPEPFLKVMQCYGECAQQRNPQENMRIESYETEGELLEAWRDLVCVEFDVSIICGYNTMLFDYKYMNARAKLLLPEYSRFWNMGRIVSEMKPVKYNEAADTYTFITTGRLNMDMIKYVRSEYKLESYKLDDICNHFLPDEQAGKVRLELEGWAFQTACHMIEQLRDIPECTSFVKATEDIIQNWSETTIPMTDELDRLHQLIVNIKKQSKGEEWRQVLFECSEECDLATSTHNYKKMFFLYQNKGSEGLLKIAEYCSVDCDLVLKVALNQKIWYRLIKMSSVANTSIDYICNRGQQVKVFNKIYEASVHKNTIVEQADCGWWKGDSAKFQGATVIEPTRGFHQEPVICLDFAAMYPSIIIGKNLCYTTLVSAVDVNTGEVYFGNTDYHEKCINGEFETYTYRDRKFTFAKKPRGILPEICAELLNQRRLVKKRMGSRWKQVKQLEKEGKYEEAKAVEFNALLDNSEQLALKIVCNSCYGFTGVKREAGGKLVCTPISVAVTSTGRKMIQDTKEYCEREYNAEVVYGDTDSVMIKLEQAPDLESAFKYGTEIGIKCTELMFSQLSELEFEKVYFPYLLLQKKNYVGLKYESIDKGKLDYKGVKPVRRDTCPLVRQVYTDVIDAIMVRKKPNEAKQIINDAFNRIYNNKIDVSEMTMSKTRKRDYKIPDRVLIPICIDGTNLYEMIHKTTGQRAYGVCNGGWNKDPNRRNYKLVDVCKEAVYCKGCDQTLSEDVLLKMLRASVVDLSLPIIHGVKLNGDEYILQDVCDSKSKMKKVLIRSFRYLDDEVDAGLCGICQENLTRQPHLTVLSKMYRSNTIGVPGIGDRVPYVVETTSNASSKMYENTIDPNECSKLDMVYTFKKLKQGLETILPYLNIGFDKRWFKNFEQKMQARFVHKTRSIMSYLFAGNKRKR